ncbi:hypothetical protein BOSEA1005_10185 [Hyphomicrobiales bacterium]|nr:hypothetical protein BOSEA1005_10185 [Hyphomicrobiales bacterium]CAI0342716.1 hypothetical protein BO1005MUT1_10009 [Hyphomicrobiales bacterium]
MEAFCDSEKRGIAPKGRRRADKTPPLALLRQFSTGRNWAGAAREDRTLDLSLTNSAVLVLLCAFMRYSTALQT